MALDLTPDQQAVLAQMSDVPGATSAAPPPPTIIEQYKDNHPELGDISGYVLARHLYDSGEHGKDESFPTFATRIGVIQSPGDTALNTGLSSAAFHLNEPIESAFAGLGALLHGDSFGQGYRDKHQELSDQHDVGAYQNPASNIGGNIAGNVADYVRLGPALRALSELVPGMSTIARSGPLGDAVSKMIPMAEINQIPQTVENQAMRQDNPSALDRVGELAGDVGKAGVEGAGAALVGSGIAKTLSGVGALSRSIGRGLTDADQVARGEPRSLYTQGAARLSSGFTGAAPSPARSALNIDTQYYNDLLDKAGISVPRATEQLTDLIHQPGMATPIAESMAKADAATRPPVEVTPPQAAPQTPPTPSGTMRTQISRDAMDQGQDILDQSHLETELSGLDPSYGSRAQVAQSLQAQIAQKLADDPSGQAARDYLASIYKDIIPLRLQGPVDPEAHFDRNAISGRLSDRGKLIQPPVTGIDRVFQQIYEGMGGGPGRVMWPMVMQEPRAAIGGGMNVAGQIPSVFGGMVGRGLNYAGQAVNAAGEPGSAMSDFLTDQGKGLLHDVPNAYQAALFPAMTGQLHGDGAFPDVYQPPTDQHASADTHDATWLGQVDRPTALAYIGSKLGPQAAQQLQGTDDNGYKAGLFQLMSNPDSRKALFR